MAKATKQQSTGMDSNKKEPSWHWQGQWLSGMSSLQLSQGVAILT